jgi:hypothetical protein
VYVFVNYIIHYPFIAYSACPRLLGSTAACRPFITISHVLLAELLINWALFFYYASVRVHRTACTRIADVVTVSTRTTRSAARTMP